jgi:hypothetical protein
LQHLNLILHHGTSMYGIQKLITSARLLLAEHWKVPCACLPAGRSTKFRHSGVSSAIVHNAIVQ